jgi:hypothetical protein
LGSQHQYYRPADRLTYRERHRVERLITRPKKFRAQTRAGQQVVEAGSAFASGSSQHS